jgi:hypothetical protein
MSKLWAYAMPKYEFRFGLAKRMVNTTNNILYIKTYAFRLTVTYRERLFLRASFRGEIFSSNKNPGYHGTSTFSKI